MLQTEYSVKDLLATVKSGERVLNSAEISALCKELDSIQSAPELRHAIRRKNANLLKDSVLNAFMVIGLLYGIGRYEGLYNPVSALASLGAIINNVFYVPQIYRDASNIGGLIAKTRYRSCSNGDW